MTKDRYPLYGLALVVGAAVAVWAGLPPALLLLLLVCPLMMFFMMRGMHGGQQGPGGHGSHDDTAVPRSDTRQGPGASAPRRPDGSHERIDQP